MRDGKVRDCAALVCRAGHIKVLCSFAATDALIGHIGQTLYIFPQAIVIGLLTVDLPSEVVCARTLLTCFTVYK